MLERVLSSPSERGDAIHGDGKGQAGSGGGRRRVEIKGLVLNLCSSSNFMVPCGYDNTDSHRTHTSIWNRQSLHFHPPGFPRCR